MTNITLAETADRLERWMEMIYSTNTSDVYEEMRKYVERIREQIGVESHKHSHWGRRTVAVDFDGVIHSYISPWQGANIIPDPPLPGAIEWLSKLVLDFNVVIFSARCNDDAGIHAMQQWFIRWGLRPEVHEQITYEPGKPSAWVFIDDRAIQFTGNFWHISPGALKKFTPWYYDQEEWKRKK